MKIGNKILITKDFNNVKRNVSQNSLKNNKTEPSFGDINYKKKAGCAIFTFALIGDAIIAPIILSGESPNGDKKETELNISKRDSLISDYKNRMEKEKEILTRKTYTAEEFLQTLNSIGKGEDGITYQKGESYKSSDKIPIFIDEIKNYEQKIYNNLPLNEQEFLDSIKANLQINGQGISKDLNSSQDVPENVKSGSLAVADSLLLLVQLGDILEDSLTQEIYNKLIFGIAEQYVNNNLCNNSLDKNIKILQNIRDNIANNMTPEEKQAYEEKYDKKLEEFKQNIEENVQKLNKDESKKDSTFGELILTILTGIGALVAGGAVILMIISAFDHEDFI